VSKKIKELICIRNQAQNLTVVRGSGTVPFRMELGGVLRVMDVLWLPKLRRSVLSVSTIEKKGFDVAFQDVQGLIEPRGSS
jgi:hypothetical protein